MRPPDNGPEERPIEGWKAIAGEMETSVDTVQRLAKRNEDPLPIFEYVGRAIAYPSALRDWRQRQKIHIRTASKLRQSAACCGINATAAREGPHDKDPG